MSFSPNLKCLAQAEGSELKVLWVGGVGWVGSNVIIENSFLQVIQYFLNSDKMTY